MITQPTRPDFSEIYVVEWSQIQSCWHVTTLKRAIEANTKAVARGHFPDFIPLFAAGSRQEAERAHLRLQEFIGRLETNHNP